MFFVILGLLLGAILFLLLVGIAYDAETDTSASDDDSPSHLEIIERQYANGWLQCQDEELLCVQLRCVSLPIMLRKGEAILTLCDDVCFAEERADRFCGGGSVRMARGVWIAAGSGQSIPRLTPIDHGMLILTNRRLVFAGDLRGMDIPLTQLTGLRYEPGTLEIYKAGRAKKLHFESDEGTAVMGRKIECVLDGGDWFVDKHSSGITALVLRGSLMHQKLSGVAQAAAREGGPSRERAIAAVLGSVTFADGTIEESEVAAIAEALADDELALGPATQQKVADEFNQLVREMQEGSVGPFLEEAISTLRGESPEFRSRLWQLCSSLIQWKDGLPEREMTLVAYLNGALVDQVEPI